MYLFFAICIGYTIQDKTNDISLENLKQSYKKNDTINFVLKNGTNDGLLYYIGMEALFINEWREVVDDVNDPFSKTEIILKLHQGEKKKVTIDLKKITILDRAPNNQSFRIKINYGLRVGDKFNVYFSQPFKIKK
jgi:hypothetical protein